MKPAATRHFAAAALTLGLVWIIPAARAAEYDVTVTVMDWTGKTVSTVQSKTAGGTFSFDTKAFFGGTDKGFYYRIKYADNLGFTGAEYTGYTDGDGREKSLVAPKNGSKQFYRLVVEDVKQGE